MRITEISLRFMRVCFTLILCYFFKTGASDVGLRKGGWNTVGKEQLERYIYLENQKVPLVLLVTTIRSDIKCKYCRTIEEEVSKIIQSENKKCGIHELYFIKVDFLDISNAELEIEVPKLFILKPPTSNDKSPKNSIKEIALNKRVKHDELEMEICKVLQTEDNILVRTKQSLYGYAQLLVIISMVLVMAFRSHLNPEIQAYVKNIVLTLIIIFILLLQAGYMWVNINRPSYILAKRESMDPIIFVPGTQSQLGVEMHTIFLAYLVLAGTFVILTSYISDLEDKGSEAGVVILCVFTLVFTWSFVFSAIGTKDPSYPFKLLLD